MKFHKIFMMALITMAALIGMFKPVSGQQSTYAIKDKDGNTYTLKTMADNVQWMTKNLNIQVDDSYCYDDDPAHCKEFGRLYTFQSAQKACSSLGEGWRLPTNEEWVSMAAPYGGVRDKSDDGGKAAFKAILPGGSSGFDVVFGGNREPDGKAYGRLRAHGFYWTATETSDSLAWIYNIGANGKMLNRHDDGDKREAFSVRCVRVLTK